MNLQVGRRTALAIDEDTLKQIAVRPIWKPLLQTTVTAGAYIGLAAAISVSELAVFWIAGWWMMGFILSGFLGASHDCAHQTMFDKPWANRVAGVCWSTVVLFNFTIYRYYHLEHHRYTSIDGDTEPNGAFGNIWDYIRSLPTLSFFAAFWSMSIRACWGEFPHFIRSEAARRAALQDNCVLLVWVLLATVLTLIWPSLMVLIYWIPLAIYFPMVFLTSLPEHYGCAPGSDQTLNTRTLKSNAVFRYFFWNGNYHAEHHVYPRVPSCNLPILHDMIGEAFKFRARSYTMWHFRVIRELLNGVHAPPGCVPVSPEERVAYRSYSTK